MIRTLFTLILVFLTATAWAAPPAKPGKDDGSKRVRATFERLFPNIKNITISRTEMPGIYEVSVPGGETLYASANGQHFLVGDLYAARGNSIVNLSELKNSRARREAMAKIDPKDFITFPAKKEKAVIYVFTDVDCSYCRKIHSEVGQLNDLGVTVNYLAYPRAGVGSGAYDRAVTAWCSANKQDALTRLKQRKAVPQQTCEPNPVAAQYQLGGALGVRGTPAIVLESGQMLPGYIPAAELAKSAGAQ